MNWRTAVFSLMVSSLAFPVIGGAQVAKRLPTGKATQKLNRKQVIERHFESRQPVPLPQMEGVVPGARLLDQARLRAAKLQGRLKGQQPSRPAASETTAVLSGINMRASLTAGEIPTAVVTGDFNNDGKQDFIVANGNTNDLWIYLGNGDGTFQLPQVIPLSKGLAPVYLATGKFSTSGNLDLVVAEADSSTIGILPGNGDGTFGYEQVFNLPEPPSAVVVDDFNHDGKPDIAAVMATIVNPTTTGVPYLALFIGDGSGGFRGPTITSNSGYYSTAWNISSGDVNGDGLPDVLITGPGNENAEVYLNNGDGTFRQGQTVYDNSPVDILLDGRLVDVNGDGCLDAVIANASGYVLVANGDCTGGFAEPTLVPMASSVAAVRLADMNGDGNLDLVTSALPVEGDPYASLGNTMSVALGDGKGDFSVGHTFVGPGQAYSLAVADFAGNGKPDVVTANNDTDTVTVYANDGKASFGFPQGVFFGAIENGTYIYPISELSFVDLNGDGKPDLFAMGAGGTDYYAITSLNDGTGRPGAPMVSDSGEPFNGNNAEQIADYRLGDFRNTGHQDVVGIGYSTGNSDSSQFIFFMPGNGDGSFQKATLTTAMGADGLMTSGDFNEDGKLDFVSVGAGPTHTLTPFLGNGNGTFRAGTPLTFTDQNTDVTRVFSGDFNHDGKLDVLVLDTSNGYGTTNTALWEFDGNGDGTFQTGHQMFSDFQPMTLADVNGDGLLDIVRYDTKIADNPTGTAPPRFTTYLGHSDGTFEQSSTYAPYMGTPLDVLPYQQFGDPLSSSLVADLNGDGKPDEIAWQFQAGELYGQVLLGNGDGTFTPTYDFFPFYVDDYPLYAHDLNGDGFTDMVEVDPLMGGVNVFTGGPAPTLQIALENPVVTGNSDCGWIFADLVSSSSRSVTLSSSIPGVMLPASVTLPANEESVQFCFTLASTYNWRQVFDIKATLDGNTAVVYGSDSYVLGFAEDISLSAAPPVYAGQSSAPLTITLTAAQGYTSKAKLSCENLTPGTSCQFASDTLDVSPSGAASTTVTLLTTPGLTQQQASFTILADDGNVAKQQTVQMWVLNLNAEALGNTSLLAVPGSTATSSVQIIGLPPFGLNCSGLPAGVTCAFSGSQNAFPNDTEMTLTVSVPAGTPGGDYPFQVDVTGGPDLASVPFTLQIMSFTMQGPPATGDWGAAGYTDSVLVTFQASANLNQSVSTTCTLDTGATCQAGFALLSTTPETTPLYLPIPAGAPDGQHQLTVTATLGNYTQTLVFPYSIASFGGSLNTSSVSINAGGSATVTARLTATTGFDDSVSLACNTSSAIVCSFSPSSVQLTYASSPSVTVTVSTNALVRETPTSLSSRTTGMLAFTGLLPLGLALGWRSVRIKRILAAWAGLVMILSISSCGGDSPSAGGRGGSSTYTATIVGTATGTSVTADLGTVDVTVSQ